MTRRKPRPDELDLWQQVARTAKPLVQKRWAPTVQTEKPVAAPPAEPLPRFRIGEKHPSKNESHLPPATLSQRLAKAPVQMDSKAFSRLKRGKLSPEARLDLHGMTLDQAHGALNRFVMNCAGQQKRLILVITGKGGMDDPYETAPMRRGVLRRQVPIWLSMQPLAGLVLQVAEAHQKHGGAGAFYVYLRRARGSSGA